MEEEEEEGGGVLSSLMRMLLLSVPQSEGDKSWMMIGNGRNEL